MSIDTAGMDLSIAVLGAAYREGRLQPREVVRRLRERMDARGDNPVWIHRLTDAELEPYLRRLGEFSPAELPLYGIPFGIKDNIDLAGVPTSAACENFAYTPQHSAHVVQRLTDAGAIPMGKTNMDQFATGLVGTRSPYGIVRNAYDPEYIAGGSSSGSAVAVADAQVSFSLGTDTAGSGRVPAAFNNLVGIKPSRGLLSTSGVVPACRSLDCISIFAATVDDAVAVMQVATDLDRTDPYARPDRAGGNIRQHFHFGVPEHLEFLGDDDARGCFEDAVQQLEAVGGTAVTVDFSAFSEAAQLLYEGPWVAERYTAIEDYLRAGAAGMDPVVRGIIEPSAALDAVSAFKAFYRLQALKRAAGDTLETVDFMLTPTTPTIYTVEEIKRDPVVLNSRLGLYTNFMNLLDLAAISVPAGFGSAGLPYGVTLFAPAFSDRALAEYARRLRCYQEELTFEARPDPVSRDDGCMTLAVCGAHMRGLALNHQLTERGGRFVAATRTAPHYRLFALPGGPPARPGLIRQVAGGSAIELELWSVPLSRVGDFLAGIPAPLGLGQVELRDGQWVTGFICEGHVAGDAEDISELGGWRSYLQRQSAQRPVP